MNCEVTKKEKLLSAIFMAPIIKKNICPQKIEKLGIYFFLGYTNRLFFLLGSILMIIGFFDYKFTDFANIFFILNILISIFSIMGIYKESILKVFSKTKLFFLIAFTAFVSVSSAEFTSCQLFDDFNPNSVPIGQIITGYSHEQTDRDHTCEDYKSVRICDKNYLDFLNFYKYPSCEDYSWKSCEINIIDENGNPFTMELKHNQTIRLFANNFSNPQETCRDLSIIAKCRDGKLYDLYDNPLEEIQNQKGIEYKYLTCTNTGFDGCLNPRKREFLNNGDILEVYSSNESNTQQTCQDLQMQLKCIDGKYFILSGNTVTNTQINFSDFNNKYFSTCTDLNKLNCKAIDYEVNGGIIASGENIYQNGETRIGYITNIANSPFSCQNYEGISKCVNGVREGANPKFHKYLNCENSGTNINLPHTGAKIDLTITYLQLGTDTDFIVEGNYPFIKLGLANIGNTGLIINQGEGNELIRCKFEGANDYVFTFPAVQQTTILKPNESKFIKFYLAKTVNLNHNGKNLICEINPINENTNSHIVFEGYIIYSGDQIIEKPGLFDNNQKSLKLKVIKADTIGRFDQAMDKSTKTIQSHLDTPTIQTGVEGINNYIINFFLKTIFPLLLVLGIVVAIIGFYELFFSTSEDSVKKGTKFLIGGVVGIVLIMSAKFITNILYNNIFSGGNMSDFNVSDILTTFYDKLIFPFLKIGMFIVLGILFLGVLVSAFNFIRGKEESIKNAKNILIRNTLGIFVIIASKQLVEAIYGKKDEVINSISSASNLGQIGGGLFSHKAIPILYQIINRIGGLSAFIILVIILIEAFKLLTNPTNEEQISKIGKKFMYIFVGIVIIGVAYILVNALIIK